MKTDIEKTEKPKLNSGYIDPAQFLISALPIIKAYEGKKIVIKYGGHVIGNSHLEALFARDIALLKQIGVEPLVVHGGGPQIDVMLKKLGIEPRFEAGLRVTDEQTLRIVEMVLCGDINKTLTSLLCRYGANACGLSGRDGNMALAHKVYKTTIEAESSREIVLDLGLVGEIETINTKLLDVLLEKDITPVLAPVASDKKGCVYNINSDSFAGALAGTYEAKRLIFLTDAPGVLDDEGKLIRKLSIGKTRQLIQDRVITGGMLPKVENCIKAVEAGVQGVVILDGKIPHAIFYELFTNEGIGTLIVADS